MKINDFAVLVSKHEGLKEGVNIAQIKEILSVVNKLTHGFLYFIVKIFLR